MIPLESIEKYKWAISTGIILVLAVAIFTFLFARSVPMIILDYKFNSTYFGSDAARVWKNFNDRGGYHDRAKVHPLFPMAICLPVLIGIKIGFDRLALVSAALALNSAALVALLYYLLFIVTKRTLDSLLFILLFLASGSFVFWSKIAETFPFGATTILLSFCVLSIPMLRGKELPFLLASIVSVSLTVTNWMSGLLSCFFSLKIRQTVVIIVKTIVIVAALWSVQKFIFPDAGHFLDFSEEKKYIKPTNTLFAMRQFFGDSLYPAQIVEGFNVMNRPTVALERNLSDGAMTLAIVIWSAWLGIILYGLRYCWKYRRASPLNYVLLFFLIGQMVLHSLYGSHEVFMYSLHWMPSLILIAAFATRGNYRRCVLAMIIALIVIIAPLNFRRNQASLFIFESYQERVNEQK
ncbi:hypothetical protein JW998_04865 [candidate division KSB1 bacterium]|nr:hypothetical protein [candidate division KSB1 bacterium]